MEIGSLFSWRSHSRQKLFQIFGILLKQSYISGIWGDTYDFVNIPLFQRVKALFFPSCILEIDEYTLYICIYILWKTRPIILEMISQWRLWDMRIQTGLVECVPYGILGFVLLENFTTKMLLCILCCFFLINYNTDQIQFCSLHNVLIFKYISCTWLIFYKQDWCNESQT